MIHKIPKLTVIGIFIFPNNHTNYSTLLLLQFGTIPKLYTLNKVIFPMVSHMVFLTKLVFENLKNLVTPSRFCKGGRVTELLDGRVTSSP